MSCVCSSDDYVDKLDAWLFFCVFLQVCPGSSTSTRESQFSRLGWWRNNTTKDLVHRVCTTWSWPEGTWWGRGPTTVPISTIHIWRKWAKRCPTTRIIPCAKTAFKIQGK
jgi:hypothetical protein